MYNSFILFNFHFALFLSFVMNSITFIEKNLSLSKAIENRLILIGRTANTLKTVLSFLLAVRKSNQVR